MEKEYSQKYLQLNRDKRIVFDTKDMPSFRVRPDLSNLGTSRVVEEGLKARYPNLRFFLGCVVDGAVLIQDLLPSASSYELESALLNLTEELNQTSIISLQVVDGRTLTYYLLPRLDAIMTRNPLLVFPGEGGKTVSDYIKNMDSSWNLERAVYLPCERVKRERDFEILADYSPLPDKIDTETVVIVDDVVATGLTAQTIAGELKKKYGNVRIIVAAWLFLNPTTKENQTSPSGIKNVNITVATLALKGNYVARPPINSLSCFLRNGVKYDQVRESFMEKYIQDRRDFERILEEMRR